MIGMDLFLCRNFISGLQSVAFIYYLSNLSFLLSYKPCVPFFLFKYWIIQLRLVVIIAFIDFSGVYVVVPYISLYANGAGF